MTTGDYMFASTGGTQAGPQLDLYLAARADFSGPLFPAMGNHECTGATASNCGAGAANGITANYSAYLSKLLAPIQKTEPYYAIKINASDSSWTAKLVFVAANAWSSTQATWLESTLSQPTTYTFVVRHESHAGQHRAGRHPVGADHRGTPVHACARRPHAHLRALLRPRGRHRQRGRAAQR